MKTAHIASVFMGLVLVFLVISPASASVVLFSEDFDGYPSNVTHDPGIPLVAEGADEVWYGGRFEYYDNGTISQDTAVRYGDYARFEDEAGILFNIGTVGYTDITMSFDWKTHNVSPSDNLVVGYFLGDLNYGLGERYRDFYTQDFGGDHSAAVNWWNTEWAELLRDHDHSGWHTGVQFSLPSNEQSIWVAFWMDNGEGNKGKIDNVAVTAAGIIPEAATLGLLLAGGLALFQRGGK